MNPHFMETHRSECAGKPKKGVHELNEQPSEFRNWDVIDLCKGKVDQIF
jgi:hypothetical protein